MAAYSLVGYLASWGEGLDLLGKSLQSALGVWSDSSCVRRMDSRQHLWLCRLLVLAATCLEDHMTQPVRSGDPLTIFYPFLDVVIHVHLCLYVY